MPASPPEFESSQSSSGYEDGLGRRVLEFDRETGGMLERLVLRPELSAFEQALTERIALVAGLEDERFSKPRAIEKDGDRLTVVSEYVAGRRLSDIIDAAADHGIVAGIDAGLGLLLELLPAVARLHDAGLVHGAFAPGRLMITPAGLVLVLDSIYGEPLERLQLTRKRLWSEFRLAFPPTAGLARFDRAADLGHASMVAATLIIGRALQDNDYPEGIALVRREIHEIASIRGTKAFADGVDKFFGSTLPLAGRKGNTTTSADEAAIDLRKLVRKELGINTCRTALLEFLQQVEAADAELAAAEAAEAAERAARGPSEAERLAQQQAEAARVEAERRERERREAGAREKARSEAERKARDEAERKARDEGERKAREEAERRAREEAERKAQEEAERKARDEAERKAREQAERKTREEAERKAREEAERKAREEAERKAREEAERRAHEEAERKAREEAERKAREEADRKAREEADRKAREEADRKAREEADRKAREEAERKAREEAERRAREEAERKAREEAERKAREKAERKAREEAERKAREEAERKAREEAERKAREEAERKAREKAERKAREEAERKAREEAERKERERAEQARLEAEKLERERRERAAEEARLKAERLERERREAERQADEARREAEQLERQHAEAERRARFETEARERAEADRAAREAAAWNAPAAPEPEQPAASKTGGWLVPPDRAAAFDPPVPHDPAPTPAAPPAPLTSARPYPIYVPPPEPAAWTAELPPTETPGAGPIAPLAAARPAAPTPVPVAPAAPAPAGIRLKIDANQPSSSPARADHRGEPDSDDLSAADAYGYTPATERPPVPWKLIAAGVVLIAGAFAITRGYTPSGGPVVETVRKVIPKGAAAAAPGTAPITGNVGRVTITTQPPGAKVTVDGKAAGETPLTIDGVKPGRHTFALVGPEGSFKRTVRVEAGQTLALDVPLFSGFVAISIPFVVNVAESGKNLGTSENQIILSPGRHDLRLSNKDLGYTATESVDVTAGEIARLDLDPRGRANINAAPWAEVWVDGEKAGETPLANVPIRLGVREIVFKNPQYPDRKQTVTITANASANISVDFIK